jgi:peptidoglycan/xylan/chitin deacetylase (PgdA/CDA1 family)
MPSADIISLCYHGVSHSWRSSLAVTPQQLHAQVSFFLARGYRPATVAETLAAPPRGRVLLVTFDDAMRSVHRLALPVLERLGVVATVYAPTHYILEGEPMGWLEVRGHLATEHAGELDPMTPDELREVARRGWEVGSHTCTHPWLTRLGDVTLATELTQSKAELEELMGQPCRTLAYPFGDQDPRVAAAAAAAGYDGAVTLPGRVPSWPRIPTAIERMTLPRIGVYRDDDWRRFRLKVSQPIRMLRRSRLWDAIPRAARGAREHAGMPSGEQR